MAIEKVVKISVDQVQAQGGLDTFISGLKESDKQTEALRTQLKNAQQDVAELSAKFGATSKEAVEAAKRAAELKDRIGDAKALTDAFNPDAKFKALSASLNGVVSGFAAYQGALGLIGVESKEVEAQILKVQSAMAIAQGAQAVGESVDAFKQLAAVVKSYSIVQKAITAAQWLWNAAMAANPIGAVVAVVTALIAAGYALVNMFIASSDATKKAEAANKALNKELETQVKNQKLATQEADLSRDAQLKYAKASGKSAEEIRKLSLELANQEVAQKMANAQTLRAIAIEAIRVAGLEDATDAQKETAKKALKEFNDANDALKASVLNRRKLIIDNKAAEIQEETDAQKKQIENRKKLEEEAIKKEKELREQKRKDELAKANEIQKELSAILEEGEKKKKDILIEGEKILKDLEISKETPAQKLKREYEEKLAILKEANLSTIALTADYNAKIFELEKDSNDQIIEQAKDLARRQIEVEEASQQAKRDALDTGLNILSQFAGKNKSLALSILAIQKGLAIADVIVGASKAIGVQSAALATANTAALATPQAIATGGTSAIPVIAANTAVYTKGVLATKITAATSIASILASGLQGAKTISGGGAPSGGGASGGGAPSGGSVSAPTFNVVGQNPNNQLAQSIAQRQSQPIEAYVVSGNISNAQSLDRNRVNTATFG